MGVFVTRCVFNIPSVVVPCLYNTLISKYIILNSGINARVSMSEMLGRFQFRSVYWHFTLSECHVYPVYIQRLAATPCELTKGNLWLRTENVFLWCTIPCGIVHRNHSSDNKWDPKDTSTSCPEVFNPIIMSVNFRAAWGNRRRCNIRNRHYVDEDLTRIRKM